MGETFVISKVSGVSEGEGKAGGDNPGSGGECGATEPSLVETLGSGYGMEVMFVSSRTSLNIMEGSVPKELSGVLVLMAL